MRILIKTVLSKNYREVYSGFDQDLFEALKPPLMSLKVKRFDGCLSGDEVHLQIGLGPLKQQWISIITESINNENECSFVDVGKKLPPPLKSWRHTHRVLNTGENQCEIQDDIEFSTGSKIQDKLIYPVLKFQFSLRTKIYQQYFS